MKTVSEIPISHDIATISLPRYAEIPRIELYMDQLVGYLNEVLAPLEPLDDKAITPSMVNNYVKKGMLNPPRAKKYNRDHIAQLIVVGILKQTLSIAEISRLIEQQVASFDTSVAYDYFCDTFEAACHALFSPAPSSPATLTGAQKDGDFERDLVIASSAAVAYTLYVRASIIASNEG